MASRKNGEKLNYLIKDYIIAGHSERIYHLEVVSKRGNTFYSDCMERETTFFLKFKNHDIDTLTIYFEEIQESRCCSYYKPHLNYNGLKLLKGDSTIGAFIVVK